MKKIISTISGALFLFAISLPISIAKSAEFFSIGTGGPTGVYFQVGNAICKMVAKIQSAEHGRKKGTDKAYRCSAPSTGAVENYSDITSTGSGSAGDLAGTILTSGAMTLTAGGSGTVATGQFVNELTID